MKKLSFILLGAFALLLMSCAEEFDDSAIWDKLDDHEDRIEELETLCKELNTNLSSLQTIVNALKTNDYITNVTPVTQGGAEVGYTITFAIAAPITIYHGKDGVDGTAPVIAVRKHTDGAYYWTLDNDWLLDGNGQMVKAEGLDGQDAVTPQLKIENDYWYVSYDNGSSWNRLGKATGDDGEPGTDGEKGDSTFKQIRQDDKNVYFVLNSGVEIIVPRSAPLSISFDSADLVIMNVNSTRNIHYTVTSSVENVTVEVLSSSDIKAEAVAETAKTGYITVVTSDEIDQFSKVVVLVSDGTRVIMSTLKFEAEAIEVNGSDDMEISHEGGTLTLYYLSNIACEVIIPEDADWLQVVGTKALQEHEVTLSVDPNDGMPRTAHVVVRSESGLYLTYVITQNATDDFQEQFEREALIEFYRAMGGSRWNNNTNWCSDRPIDEWYGVDEFQTAAGRIININLTGNNLTGSIPDSFWTNLPLSTVQMSNNSISGGLSPEIGRCGTLQALEMSNVGLTGGIPRELARCTEIYYFNVSSNMLTGSLPVDVAAEWPKLEYCNLSYNSFSGTIPAEFAQYMDKMYIYGNYFSGDIPQSVTEHELWWRCWMDVYFQYTAPDGQTLNTEGVVIPGPKFSIQDLDGNMVDSQAEYSENELTVMVSWYTSDTSMIEAFLSNYEEYHNKGVGFVSWNSYDEESTIRNYVTSRNIPWPHLEAGANFYKLVWTPIVLVVDKNGELIYQNLTMGENVFDFIENRLSEENLYVSTDYSQDGLVFTLQTATVGNGIDIVLMGDGYSDRMIASGRYREVMEEAMDYLFVEEPYKSFRDYFNVYMVNAVSENEVIEQSTVFSTRFGEGTHVEGDSQTVFQYAGKAISQSRMDEAMIVVMQNSKKYAGTCWMYYPSKGDYGSGTSISYFPIGMDGEEFKRVLNHETCGHGFAKLDDEYAYEYKGAITAEEIEVRDVVEPYGWYRNTDLTNDLSSVKWAHFLSDSRYANEGLGAYEGASTYWSGIWRSTENSIMRHNTGGFNAPSREAIYYRIHKLAYGDSWQYDYEDFVEYDAKNRTGAAASRRKAQVASLNLNYFEPLAPPVVVRKTWREVMDGE